MHIDVDQPRNTNKDPLHVPNGPMTRYKTKPLKEALVLNVIPMQAFEPSTLYYLIVHSLNDMYL
jgi:hypothetical protein